MQLHLKCILITSLYIAGCHQNARNAGDTGGDAGAAATATTMETSNGAAFQKQGELAFLSKSGADTIRKIDIQLAQTDEQRAAAESVIAAVNGVKSVNNSITVKPRGPSPEELRKQADDALVAKVNDNFATYKVQGVTATVADSVVTLTGEIKRANLQNAMKAAMESGAKKVDNKLTIK